MRAKVVVALLIHAASVSRSGFSHTSSCLLDDLRERVASLATAQNVTTDAMLNALVEREELCRKLSLQTNNGDAVPEQQIAGIVSRYFSALSERSETGA